MADNPRDFNQWVKSVERRLNQAIRSGQSAQAVRLARDVQNIRNEVENIEAGTSPAPAAPIELVTQTRLFINAAGRQSGEVSVDFPDVIRDVNGGSITVDRYELWIRDMSGWDGIDEETEPAWVLQSTGSESSLSYAPLTPNRDYQIRVRAVARGVPGPYSVTVDVTIEKDTTPPPIPAALELTSSGATVTASWNSLAETGDPMPGDFAFTEVAYDYQPAPDEVVATLTMTFLNYIFETPPIPDDENYDGTWYFRHRAVDTSGNRSAWSPQTQIVPKKLVDDASIRFELEEKQRQIDEAKQLMDTGLTEVNDKLIPLEQLSQENQAALDTLNNTTLPALEEDLTALQGELDGIDLTGINNRLDEAESDLDTLNNTTLPELNNTITQGLADLDWREVGAISASNIRVGSYENLLPEDYIWELREKGLDGTPMWGATAGGAAGWTTITNQLGMPVLIRFSVSQHNGATSRLAFMGPSGKGLRVRPGEEFSLTGTGWVSSRASEELLLEIRYATEDGSYVIRRRAGQFPNGSFSHDWTVPNDTSIQRMQIEFTAASAVSGNAHMGDIRLRTRITSNLIVDGAVIADKIATNAVESDKIVANAITAAKITSNAVTADKIDANAVTAGKIAANAVTAGKINANAVSAREIAADSIAANHMQANSVGADQIIANSVGAEHVQARSIQAHQLQVGSFDNMFPDPNFFSYRDYSTQAVNPNSPWVVLSGSPETMWSWQDDTNAGPSIVNVRTGSASRMEIDCGEVSAGDELFFRCRVRKTSNADNFHIYARSRDENGSWVTSNTLLSATLSSLTADSYYEITWTVPNNPSISNLWIDFVSSADSVGTVRFSDVYVRRRVTANLLVDGSVTARSIAAEAVNAEHITASSSLTAKVASFLTVESNMIAANAVTADKISFGSLNGALITGLQIQTHTNNRGVKLTSAGIRAFDSSGNETFTVDASSGDMTATSGTITGVTIQTGSNISATGGVLMRADPTYGNILGYDTSGNVSIRLGGARNEFSGSVTASDITGSTLTGGEVRTSSNWSSSGGAIMRAYGAAGNFVAVDDSGTITARLGGGRNELAFLNITGALRMGSSSAEGALVPDRSRLRLQGRMPFDDGVARDMFLYGLSPGFQFSGSEGPVNGWSVTYPEPRPNSNSAPIVAATVNDSRRHLSVNTANERIAGFDAVFMPLYAHPNAAATFRCRYISVWRG